MSGPTPALSPYYWLGYAVSLAAAFLLWKVYRQWRKERSDDKEDKDG